MTTPTGTCLVTGGAGFIGCALSPALADRFDRVVVLDNLHPQVHARHERPAALDARVELVVGDVASRDVWDDLLSGGIRPDTIVHLAAETGTAQSLTEATRHAEVNVIGTTQMLDALVRHDALPTQVLLTSSRAVYGEGAWTSPDGAVVYPGQRSHAQLEAQRWDAVDGGSALPHRASRTVPRPTSVYGSTKLAQEHVLGAWALAVGVVPIVLRLQNVYGPGQSLSNPYTGIVPFFAGLARRGEAAPLYEDGQIVRDFVFIDDVAAAILAALRDGRATPDPYDVGSGSANTIARLAELVAARYGAPAPVVVGRFRDGDVRYAAADVSDTVRELGWTPTVDVSEGVDRLCAWIDSWERGEG
ncbi:NAD(P)-dependent oxidoreductase [Cellulomonas sp. URHD0024]|uniref:NAD-dependent epimerase/dehydratase family protein n=1 Tax=Cellulomonas sp. URHD0024 TaxID=1302620 RepID=UPI00040DDB77|nr:NAD-dependent epimerase/dehydratase family protein [Cellulomonas sp. URHD0024]